MSTENGICCAVGDRVMVPCPHSPTGMIADRPRRMDGSSRPAAAHMVADSSSGRVVRFDADDPLSKANRELEERLATQWCRTDAERAQALTRLESTREHSAWFEGFTRERLARENERHDSADSLDDARRRAEFRINNAARSPGAPARVPLYRHPSEDPISFAVREYVAEENRLAAVNHRINSQWKGEKP